jgi:mono/diheme cytochrome c family protein
MVRKALKVLGILLGVLALAAAGLVANAERVARSNHASLPHPKIAADRSPEATARGEMLFQTLCMSCHGNDDGRATGKRLDELPESLGAFWAANLAHPTRGVHARSDGEIARVLRSGVLPDGRFSPVMYGFRHLGDADVAALLGYMRSRPSALEPAGEAQPRSQHSLLMKLLVAYLGGADVGAPPKHVPVPRKAPTVEYGRYMAQAMDCVVCHTEGFSPDKLEQPDAFAGGFEFVDPTGAKIWSKNITRDEATGLGRWSLDEFERAVTRGVTKDGHLVRKPMPLFSRLDRTDVEAIWRFLGSRPGVSRANRPGGHPLQKAAPDEPAEVMFVNVGCASCHGESAPHRDAILGAAGKAEAVLTEWILDPQASKPGSMMPSFGAILDRAQAAALARYVKELAQVRAAQGPRAAR